MKKYIYIDDFSIFMIKDTKINKITYWIKYKWKVQFYTNCIIDNFLIDTNTTFIKLLEEYYFKNLKNSNIKKREFLTFFYSLSF